jgi:anaerobic selenocysteine-containing dehydrogenase
MDETTELKLDRRSLLKWAAGGAIAASFLRRPLGQVFATAPPSAEEWGTGEEKWTTTTCLLCPGACSVRVRTVDGRVVKTDGNPLSPVNSGRLCPRGLAAVHLPYHPDRLTRALRRRGRAQQAQWEQVKTEEALEAVRSEAHRLAAEGKGSEIFFVEGGNPHRLSGYLMREWLRRVGSAHCYSDPLFSPMERAGAVQQGVQDFAYDYENARVILSFGASLLEGNENPVHIQQAIGKKRGRGEPSALTLIQADSRYSVTAAKADDWLAVRQGTYGVLALGIAYVLLNEGLVDTEFLEAYGDRLADFVDEKRESHPGFRSTVLQNYGLDYVSRTTGVPTEKIISAAHRFWEEQPGFAVADWSLGLSGEGLRALLAVHSLNALVGNIDRPGGVIVPRSSPLADFAMGSPAVSSSDATLTPAGNEHPSRGYHWLFSGRNIPDAPRISLLFLHNVNPYYWSGFNEGFVDALSKIPMIVSLATFPNETDLLSDLLIPESSFLEEWDLVEKQASANQVVQVVQPVVSAPSGVSLGQVALTLARTDSAEASGPLASSGMEDAVRSGISHLVGLRRGMILDTVTQRDFVRAMEERGWWDEKILPDSPEDAFLERGGWTDPYFPYGEFGHALPTAHRKFRFEPARFLRAEEGADFSDTPPEGGQKSFRLLLFYPLAFWGVLAPLPYLSELSLNSAGLRWDSWVEIHPRDAEALGVKTGDRVQGASVLQKTDLRVVVTQAVPAGTIGLPLGLGHRAGGPFSEGFGVNPLSLSLGAWDTETGLPVWQGRILLTKVT